MNTGLGTSVSVSHSPDEPYVERNPIRRGFASKVPWEALWQ